MLTQTTMSRRSAIGFAGSLLITTIAGPATGLASAGPWYCFCNESGKPAAFHERIPFVLGALFTSDPSTHSKRILDLKKRISYPRILKYSSTDRKKVPFAISVIDYLMQQNEMFFAALAVSEQDNYAWPEDREAFDVKYFSFYKRLLEAVPNNSISSMGIYTEKRTTTGEDDLLYEFLSTYTRWPSHVNPSYDSGTILLQVSDLLVGCILGDALPASALPDGRSKSKSTIVEYLKRSLDVESLWAPTLATSKKFRVDVAVV